MASISGAGSEAAIPARARAIHCRCASGSAFGRMPHAPCPGCTLLGDRSDVQDKAVRSERRGPLDGDLHFPDRVASTLGGAEIHVGWQVDVQARAFARADPADFPDLLRAGQQFSVLAGLKQEQGNVFAARGGKAQCWNVFLVEQKGGAAQPDVGKSVFFHAAFRRKPAAWRTP